MDKGPVSEVGYGHTQTQMTDAVSREPDRPSSTHNGISVYFVHIVKIMFIFCWVVTC